MSEIPAMFRGMIAFPITPADEAGRVDTGGVQALLGRLEAAGVQSIGLLGSTGIYAYLSASERRRAVEAAVERLGGRVPVIVGAGALRTDAAVALARDAEAAGADGLLLAPVSYTPLLDAEVLEHFRAVAGATALPICIYDNPATTGFTFRPELVGRLAGLPTVAALKTPAPAAPEAAAAIAAFRARVPAGFPVGCSGDWHCAEALLAGADAWYSVIGGLLPAPALALARAALAGDRAETERLDAAFAPLWELFRQLGSLRVVHAAAAILRVTEASPPRPILPLDAADRRRVGAALEALAAAERVAGPARTNASGAPPRDV
ncbi:MAG TPA: dihydrodipicolinate synthase family protein [Amaricoccus sp.]|nr:dihydrodipicolinate synthase family protein [Amaricoccus sp.]